MLSKRDQQEIKNLRAIRDGWVSCIRCVTGKICGEEYCFHSPAEITEFLDAIGL